MTPGEQVLVIPRPTLRADGWDMLLAGRIAIAAATAAPPEEASRT